MKQSDLFLESEGDAFYARNKDKPRLPDPVIEAIQACQLKPKTILELGCGNGWRLAEINTIFKPQRYFGYDASAEAIANTVVGMHIAKSDLLWALQHIKNSFYDTIIFGFCLYLIDREDLMMIAAHTDRILQDKGHIVIHDFFPDGPYRVPYKHKEGVWSYHQDYRALWLGNPVYKTICGPNASEAPVIILQKDMAAAWPVREP